MSKSRSGVQWYGQRVRGEVDGATKAAIRKIAFDIEAGTKAQITSNQQIDTGFMRNSVYTHTDQGVGGGAKSGRFASSGRTVERIAADPASLSGADAIVGVGASYAVYQELKRSFLRVSFERVVQAAGGTVKTEFSGKGF